MSSTQSFISLLQGLGIVANSVSIILISLTVKRITK